MMSTTMKPDRLQQVPCYSGKAANMLLPPSEHIIIIIVIKLPHHHHLHANYQCHFHHLEHACYQSALLPPPPPPPCPESPEPS